MEEWDILDLNRENTGRIAVRGEYLKPGDYHLVVLIFIVNSKSEILITKRSREKNGALLWEICGGAVIAGEISHEAALREMKEEIGLVLSPANNKGKIIGQATFEEPHGWMADIWMFKSDCDIENLILQEEEICDVRWSNRDEIIDMIDKNVFFKGDVFIKEVFDKGIL